MEPISAVPGPALATLTKQRFSRDGWIFERKLDGMRVIASRSGEIVKLRSRNDLDAAGSFPEVVETLESQGLPDFVVDGEVVAFDGAQTSFALLQRRMHISNPDKARRSGVTVFYYVFDLLHLDGHSTRGLPLRERKALLRDLLDWQDPLRFTRHRNADGESYFEEACGKGWEGLIAKRADSIYRTGRTPDWLKFKCEQGQEFVIGGWTEPQGARSGFGALLLGYYDDAGGLRYAGKVGTGFDATRLATVLKQLQALSTPQPPYDASTLPKGQAWRRSTHWVKPELVAQIAFSEWTRDGQLRHPRFQGLRTDKEARQVVREVPGA